MSTNFWKVVCDEHGIGGSGEHCGVKVWATWASSLSTLCATMS
jgi:hypothetical protein